jgi:hypothetical protein
MDLDLTVFALGVLALTVLSALVGTAMETGQTADQRRRIAEERQELDLQRGMLAVEREMLAARRRTVRRTPQQCCPWCSCPIPPAH